MYPGSQDTHEKLNRSPICGLIGKNKTTYKPFKTQLKMIIKHGKRGQILESTPAFYFHNSFTFVYLFLGGGGEQE